MRTWFASLSLHRKLITLVLGVSTACLAAAYVGFVAFDLVRFRSSAAGEAQAMAQVIAENTAASIVFGDTEAAAQILASVSVRPVMVRACVYREDGSLLASYVRQLGQTCPDRPGVSRVRGVVGSLVPVVRNGRNVGAVYVERTLSDMGDQLMRAAAGGAVMLIVAAALAFGLATSLQRTISGPIVELAKAVRAIGGEPPYQIPAIHAPPDETGELVSAFNDMVRRMGEANVALQAEVERRRQMQTERESLLRREREASRLKDEFLAAVSHELRTPLNAILGWTQLLASSTPDEATLTKALSSLSRNVRAQNRVIEDLLDISRVTTGKMQLALTVVDLRTVVESSLEVIGPVAAAKNIRIETQLPDSACLVQADYDRLRQILWNLLSNAVKFTPPGGRVTVRLGDQPGSHVVEVSDTGAGIAVEFLPHVFERFRQADGSITREHAGLGLGLAIVKELTELHGGSVRADSAGKGLGATFTLRLPRVAGVAARQSLEGEPSAPIPRLDGLSVLVVDDNADSLELASSALRAVGARVRMATSGTEALAQWQQAPSQILLCDLAMPRMDGFEVLGRIRRMDAAAERTTAVLALTAYASDEYRVRCLRAGFHSRIVKPYDTGDLVRAVAAALEQI